MENWNEGDIVQITNEEHHWYPCLVIVSEPKSWGIQGYVPIPIKEKVAPAYIRLEDKEITIVGKAVITT